VALNGIPVHLVDTAGIRETDDPVERIGVERALAAAQEADVLLHISDGLQQTGTAGKRATAAGAQVIHVHNKIDLTGDVARSETVAGETHVWISARYGSGIELLKDAILRAAGGETLSEGVFTARQRHIDALRLAAGHVDQALARVSTPEFAAEELRLAQEALSRITGEHVADDLLGEIFARFCIGK
jgi:tRNA modification GTPase